MKLSPFVVTAGVRLALVLALAPAAQASPWAAVRAVSPGPPAAIGEAANGCLAGAASLPVHGEGFVQIRRERLRHFGHPVTLAFVMDLKNVTRGRIEEYTKKYNSPPNSFGGYAWDGFYLLVNALEKAGADRAAIRDALENTQNYSGVSGVFNMSASDHNGLAEDSMVMVRIENGKWKLIK